MSNTEIRDGYHCSGCRAPWLKRWIYCPHCEPGNYQDLLDGRGRHE